MCAYDITFYTLLLQATLLSCQSLVVLLYYGDVCKRITSRETQNLAAKVKDL